MLHKLDSSSKSAGEVGGGGHKQGKLFGTTDGNIRLGADIVLVKIQQS